jgi:phytoene dehydrogenase-like protein
VAHPDAIVVGSGPNGLAAAITLAQAGLRVHVVEAEQAIGGGARSAELTLPGFVHDYCSALHPIAYASPFFRRLPLHEHGLIWIHSPAALGHPFEDGRAIFLEHSVRDTAAQLGRDRARYSELFTRAARAWNSILEEQRLGAVVRHMATISRLGLAALRSAAGFVASNFVEDSTRALMAGMTAHSGLPLEKPGSAGIALALAAAGHSGGWPFPRGGAQKLADALASYLRFLGGTFETGLRIRNLRQLPPARAILLDLTPRQVLEVAGDQLPPAYSRIMARYKYGMAAFKLDWALSAPVPWRNSEMGRAATCHIGGSFEEIATAERVVWNGKVSQLPFLIAAQHTLFDPTRAPQGKHTLWAYCHVPNGWEGDMVERIERQIERFAPGFRDTILARSAMAPRALEAHNNNLVGGDFLGGVQDLPQLFVRPTLRYYTTPLSNVYICSASTPPGAGVHGMCGHLAARLALRRTFRLKYRTRVSHFAVDSESKRVA